MKSCVTGLLGKGRGFNSPSELVDLFGEIFADMGLYTIYGIDNLPRSENWLNPKDAYQEIRARSFLKSLEVLADMKLRGFNAHVMSRLVHPYHGEEGDAIYAISMGTNHNDKASLVISYSPQNNGSYQFSLSDPFLGCPVRTVWRDFNILD